MDDKLKLTIGILIAGAILLLIAIFVGGRAISAVVFNNEGVRVELDDASQNNTTSSNQSTQLQHSSPTESSTTAPPATNLPPVDTNPPVSLPFSDNFDQGVSSLWRIVEGTPMINSGRVAGADSISLEIGNDSLSQYTVQFEVYGNQNCTWGYNNYLTIGVSPYLQYRAAYTDMYGRGRWYAFKDGEWDEIARDENGVGCNAKVKVVVNGSSYKIYADGKISSELMYGTSTGAPFLIGTDKFPMIDNLTITSP